MCAFVLDWSESTLRIVNALSVDWKERATSQSTGMTCRVDWDDDWKHNQFGVADWGDYLVDFWIGVRLDS